MEIIVGIDVGGSTTKIVGYDGNKLYDPLLVKATDPVASVYGAFGKFTSENSIGLESICGVMITGVGSSHIENGIYGLQTTHINEFSANGRGGLYLSGLNKAVIASMGTGTAFVFAENGRYEYLGGTGVGGGTLVGLSKRMLGMSNAEQIAELAQEGDLDNIDLRIADITKKNIIPTLSGEATAANFGRVSDLATNADIALGILNLVFETIAMTAIFASRQKGVADIVLIGNLAGLPQAHGMFKQLGDMFGVNFIIPKNATFATVIGAALLNKNK